MKLLKYIVSGIAGGLIFAIVAFVLITPYLRDNAPAVLFWGLQGFLYAISFYLLNLIFSQRINRITKHALIGAFSGLFSTSFNIVISLKGFFAHDTSLKVVIPPELIRSLYFELSFYVFGCVILRMLIGMIINLKKVKT
jgi:hypothetical protein